MYPVHYAVAFTYIVLAVCTVAFVGYILPFLVGSALEALHPFYTNNILPVLRAIASLFEKEPQRIPRHLRASDNVDAYIAELVVSFRCNRQGIRSHSVKAAANA